MNRSESVLFGVFVVVSRTGTTLPPAYNDVANGDYCANFGNSFRNRVAAFRPADRFVHVLEIISHLLVLLASLALISIGELTAECEDIKQIPACRVFRTKC